MLSAHHSQLYEAALCGSLDELSKLCQSSEIAAHINESRASPDGLTSFLFTLPLLSHVVSKRAESAEQVHKQLCVIERLLNAKANPDAEGSFGARALHVAKSHAVVVALVRAGADINAQNNMGETPLILHTRFAELDMVRVLLDLKADCNMAKNDGNTVLQAKAMVGVDQSAVMQCKELIRPALAAQLMGVLDAVLSRDPASIVVAYVVTVCPEDDSLPQFGYGRRPGRLYGLG